jgi:hypothetical protein
MADAPAPRVPDSHKNAFWIYGVTAMILREPLAIVTRDVTAKGFSEHAVQMECLRMLAVLLVLSRQFLSAGVYFDRVYLQPDSAAKFPRRSYPLDFLTRLADLLAAVAASTVVGGNIFSFAGLTPFVLVMALLFVLDGVWLAVAKAAQFSTVTELSSPARASMGVFALCLALYAGARIGNIAPETLDAALLLVIVVSTMIQLGSQIRAYGRA